MADIIRIEGALNGRLHTSLRDAILAMQASTAQVANVLPIAIVKTSTFVAIDTRDDLRQEIKDKIDRPTRFTQNSPQIVPATLSKQTARLYIRDQATKGTPPAKYLQPIVLGGDRRKKRFERALQAAGYMSESMFVAPAVDARLNQYGNITAGQHNKMLVDLRANPDPMQNRTGRPGGYFVMRRGTTPIGVYIRRGRQLRKWLNIFDDTPNYARQFDFGPIIEHHSERRAPGIFLRVMQRELEIAI